MINVLLPVLTIWWREIIRFFRQRSRLFSAIAQPLIFWVLIGSGLSASFQPAGTPENQEYIEYFYPGIVVLVLLFTAIFATISVVNERREGFLQGILVAPVSRWSIVLGQALGGTTLALIQGILVVGHRTIHRNQIWCNFSVDDIRCDVSHFVWFDKSWFDDCMENGINTRFSCGNEPNSDSNMVVVRCVLSNFWRSGLVGMGHEN